MRKLFKGEKRAFKVTDVRRIILPLIDELSCKAMLGMIKNDEEVLVYLPDEYLKKLKPDHIFFFNIINTVHPGFLPQLIEGT